MVDALQPARPAERTDASERAGQQAPIAVTAFDAAARARHAAMCREAVHGPHQDPLWLAAWADANGADMMAVTIGEPARPQLMLVLEVARRGLFRTARFPGGSHANGSFAATIRGFTGSDAAREAVAGLPAAISAARPDIDLLSLERMEPDCWGMANPLSAIATGESPNVALAVELAGGFEALLERASGKRKMKKYRAQLRKFEAAGGHRLVRAESAAEVETLLDAFFAMKAERFRRMGIADVFAGRAVRDFFRRLFCQALEAPSPRFVLDGLEVGGRLRAVTGSSIIDGRMTCDFSAMDESGIEAASPGEFLFFEMMRRACDEELAVFDFSVGDERYKRLWHPQERRQLDVFVPLTRKGRSAAFAQQRLAAAKRAVKDNPVAWALAKRLRRGLRGSEAKGPPADDGE